MTSPPKIRSNALVDYLRSLPDRIIPPLDRLEEVINSCVVLSNKNYPRESAVKRMVNLVMDWMHRYGRESTVNLVETFLIENQLAIIRREENGNVTCGAGRGENQLGDVPVDLAVAERAEGRQIDSGRQSFRVIEGGVSEGNKEGDGAAEQASGGIRSGPDGISKRLVQLELSEHEEDLRVFRKAYSGIRARVRTVEDEGRLMKLALWSGTTATMGILELVIHHMERVIGELKDILAKIEAGEIPDLDKE